jgi:hypothetical protein
MIENNMENGIETKIARLEEQLKGAREALSLQAREYERRLQDLNGEAGRLQEMQQTYLEKNVYEIGHRYLTERLDSVTKLVYIGLGAVLAIELLLKFIQ